MLTWNYCAKNDTLSTQISHNFSATISKAKNRHVVEFVENKSGNVSHFKYSAGRTPEQAVRVAERIAGMM